MKKLNKQQLETAISINEAMIRTYKSSPRWSTCKFLWDLVERIERDLDYERAELAKLSNSNQLTLF